jgi:hypothetical protein
MATEVATLAAKGAYAWLSPDGTRLRIYSPWSLQAVEIAGAPQEVQDLLELISQLLPKESE